MARGDEDRVLVLIPSDIEIYVNNLELICMGGYSGNFKVLVVQGTEGSGHSNDLIHIQKMYRGASTMHCSLVLAT